ncbi:MAG: septum formation initiator family protein [Patescibacteria group bacterium]
MREFQARKKQKATWQKTIHSKWFLLFLCVIIFFLARGLHRMYGKYQIVNGEFQELEADKARLQQRQEELDKSIKRIDGERGKDYEIRKKLDVIRPGEKVLYIMDTP